MPVLRACLRSHKGGREGYLQAPPAYSGAAVLSLRGPRCQVLSQRVAGHDWTSISGRCGRSSFVVWRSAPDCVETNSASTKGQSTTVMPRSGGGSSTLRRGAEG